MIYDRRAFTHNKWVNIDFYPKEDFSEYPRKDVLTLTLVTDGKWDFYLNKIRYQIEAPFVLCLNETDLFQLEEKFEDAANTVAFRLRRYQLSRIFRKGSGDRKTDTGEMKLQMENDIEKLTGYIKTQFGIFELKCVVLAAVSVMLIRLEWRLALIGFAVIPATLFRDSFIWKKENILNEENRKNDSDQTEWMHETVSCWKQIRAFCLEKRQEKQFIRYQHNYAIYNSRWINFWVTRYLIIPRLKNEFLMEAGVYFLGGLLIFSDRMTAGQLLVFIVYYHMMTQIMTDLSALNADLQSDWAIYRRILENSGKKKCVKKGIACGEIRKVKLKNMGFSYGNENILFEHLDMKAEKGALIGIKGKSGAGKSSLLQLLLGFEIPAHGEIKINDIVLGRLDEGSYFQHVSGVLQEMTLFHDTIRENLYYADRKATDREMEEACRKAGIWEMISDLPDGLDTVVGEMGGTVSGGEMQRILLARAFLRDADLYFFDEPASALDRKHADLVYQEIRKLAETRIVFLISHDDSIYEQCDLILPVGFCSETDLAQDHSTSR